MVIRQIPTPEIFADLQSVPHADVPAQGLASKAALEADDMIALHRSPDRHRRHSHCFRLDGLSELVDGLLHCDDQRRQLIRCQGMIAEIACDDFRYRV
jgi:hypothetical protein